MHYKTIDHDKEVNWADVQWEEFVSACDTWRNEVEWETIDE